MTTDLDGKPMLCLKEQDVRDLLSPNPPTLLLAKLDKFLTDCANFVPGPAFGRPPLPDVTSAHPATPYQYHDPELGRPGQNTASMDGRVM